MIIVEDSSLLTVPKQRLIPHHAGPHREAPGPVRRQREGEKQCKNFYCSFLGKPGKARQAGLGLSSLNIIGSGV